MKRFKIVAIAVLMVSSLAMTFAFTTSHKKAAKAVDTWFTYNLTTNTGFDNPANYTLVGSTEPTNPGGANNIVNAIKVDASTEVYGPLDPNPGKPKVDITGAGTINAAISTATSTHVEQANRVTLKP